MYFLYSIYVPLYSVFDLFYIFRRCKSSETRETTFANSFNSPMYKYVANILHETNPSFSSVFDSVSLPRLTDEPNICRTQVPPSRLHIFHRFMAQCGRHFSKTH